MTRIHPSFVLGAVIRSCILLGASLLLRVGSLPAQGHLWQLDSGGDEIHVIDYASGATVDRISVGPEPHGIAAPDDVHVVYVSIEANARDRGELLWIDPTTRVVTRRLEVGPEPHEIATTPDGRWVYVPCRDGHYWVVDARERRVVKRIRTGGRPHNTRASRHGRFMYLSPMGDPERVFIVDVEAGHRVVGHIKFRNSVRPPAMAESRGLFFQHVDGLDGFQVADLHSRRVVATVEHEGDLGWLLLPLEKLGWIGPEGLKRCHGLEVRPGEEEIWSVCGDRVSVHELTSGRYSPIGRVSLPAKGYWLTFSPNGKFACVALSEEGRVVMVDSSSRRVGRSFRAGRRPKRNLVVPRGAVSRSSTRFPG